MRVGGGEGMRDSLTICRFPKSVATMGDPLRTLPEGSRS